MAVDVTGIALDVGPIEAIGAIMLAALAVIKVATWVLDFLDCRRQYREDYEDFLFDERYRDNT